LTIKAEHYQTMQSYRTSRLTFADGLLIWAGMRVLAIPNPQFPPAEEALAAADAVLASVAELTPAAVEPPR
jgi:hypothetical protein